MDQDQLKGILGRVLNTSNSGTGIAPMLSRPNATTQCDSMTYADRQQEREQQIKEYMARVNEPKNNTRANELKVDPDMPPLINLMPSWDNEVYTPLNVAVNLSPGTVSLGALSPGTISVVPDKPITKPPADIITPTIADTASDNIADMSTEELTHIIQQLSVLPTKTCGPNTSRSTHVSMREALYDDMRTDVFDDKAFDEYYGGARQPYARWDDAHTDTRPNPYQNRYDSSDSEEFGDAINVMYTPQRKITTHVSRGSYDNTAEYIKEIRYEMMAMSTRIARMENVQNRLSKDCLTLVSTVGKLVMSNITIERSTSMTSGYITSMLDLMAEIVRSVDSLNAGKSTDSG